MAPTQFAAHMPVRLGILRNLSASERFHAHTWLASSGGALLLALAYYLGARIGFALQSPTVPQSILWLPNSILLCALLLVPRRGIWPVFLVAGYPAHLAVAMHAGAPLFPLSLLYLTNWLDAALGASLILHFVRPPIVLSRLRNMMLFLGAASFATILVTFADAGVTLMTGLHSDYWASWLTRARSNLLTNVVWVPAVLGLHEVLRPRILRERWLEVFWAILLILVTAGVSLLTFSHSSSKLFPVLLYAPTPILLVGAVYFGVGVVGTQLLLVALAASWSTLHAAGNSVVGIFSLQVFLFAMAVPLLCFASVVSERSRTATALSASARRVRRQLARMRTIYATLPVGLAFVDRQFRVVDANNQLRTLDKGYLAERGTQDIRSCLPALAPHLEPMLTQVFENGEIVRERPVAVYRSANAPVTHCLITCVPTCDVFGDIIGSNIVVQDVTDRKRAEQALRDSNSQLRESNTRRAELAGRMISAQEAERRRIARELHDHFSQRLAEISIELGAVRGHLGKNKDAVSEGVNRARVITTELTTAMRDLSHNLHPAVLKHAGLAAALQSICDGFARQHGVKIACEAEDFGGISDEVALCLYRIAQEALNNVARHAKASHVHVRLVHRFMSLELTVRDDGSGFDPRSALKNVGLFSAAERARLVSGTVTIESAGGHGTVVRAVVPITRAPSAPE